jgi:hypothetical protein
MDAPSTIHVECVESELTTPRFCDGTGRFPNLQDAKRSPRIWIMYQKFHCPWKSCEMEKSARAAITNDSVPRLCARPG